MNGSTLVAAAVLHLAALASPVVAQCTGMPDGTPCDDGLFCNGSDTCLAGACASTGDPCDGPDDDLDCSESCDEAIDACTSPDPAYTVWAVSMIAGRPAEFPTQVELVWDATCALAPDHAVYEGALGNFSGHLPVVCTTEGATSTTIFPGDGNPYYLVVPQDPSPGTEGSYGFASDGSQREPSPSTCESASVCDCP